MQHKTQHPQPPPPSHHLQARPPLSSTQTCFALFIALVIAAAASWTLLVCLIHWRGHTTGMSRQHRRPSPSSPTTPPHRWTDPLHLTPYTRGRGKEYTDFRTANVELDSQALVSARDLPLQTRDAASPLNPFLVVPGQALGARGSILDRQRGEQEWVQRHYAFFGDREGENAMGSIFAPKRRRAAHAWSRYEEVSVGIEAQEAQGRGAVSANDTLSEMSKYDGEGMSWVDVGLAAVDGAVEKVAAGIVRWADDGGRDEELVLPLARGRSD